ncbi:MAG: hypothetical protein ABIT01_15980 [Thermoanaerobaculia bacterium]
MRFVGELLAETGDLTIRRLRRASEWQKRNGGTIERALVETGALTEEVLTAALAEVSGLPAVTRERLMAAEPAVVESLPAEARRRLRAIPFEWCGVRLTVAVSEPDNTVLETGLVAATGYDIELAVVTDPVLEDCLLAWERRESESRGTASLDETHAERSAFTRLGRAILANAVRLDALELELGIDNVSGFARTIHARLPPMTRRLDRTLMPQLLVWFRDKARPTGPLENAAFTVESRRLDGTLRRIDVELMVNRPEQLKLRFETDQGWSPSSLLDPSEECLHPRSENDLFCPRCGEPIF